MKRGSSLRFIGWPIPETSLLVLGCGMGGLLLLSGGALHRLDDVEIAGAAAEVARERLADLELARVRVPLEARAGGLKHARRPLAALQAVLFPESLWQRMELSVFVQARLRSS